MAQDDIWRATAQFSMPQATIAQWVWHYQQVDAGDPSPAEIGAATESVLAAAWAELETNIVPGVVGDTLELALFDPVNAEFNTLRTELIDQLTGSATAEMLPHQDAPVVKFFTAVGRSVGKKFIFGFSEGAQFESIVVPGALQNMIDFALAFDNAILPGGIRFVPGNFNLATQTFRNWTQTVAANSIIGTQDRRRPGIGI